MKLSIITINYNNKNGLQKTIDSVVSQTFKDFEWIIIDGGSTDGSKELIKKYSQYITYWVSEPDKGIYNAMNKGIIKSSGEYLLFLNSGDKLYCKQVLEHVFNQPHKEDIIYGDEFYIDREGNRILIKPPLKVTLEDYIFRKFISHQSCFIKREIIYNHPYNENYKISGDTDFLCYCLCTHKTFKYLNIPIADFMVGGISSNHKLCSYDESKALSLNIGKLILPIPLQRIVRLYYQSYILELIIRFFSKISSFIIKS